jgi:hypothetical protein
MTYEELAWARSRPELARRDTPVDVMVSLTLDPLTRVDSARRELDAAERAGVTHVAASFVADSRDHYEEQVAALVSLERYQPPGHRHRSIGQVRP